MDQTCFGCSGGFDPVSLPLFQGVACSQSLAHFRGLPWSHSFAKERRNHALSLR
jgi:hypothetical protein